MISASLLSLQTDDTNCIIAVTILLSQKMLIYIFMKSWSKISWTLLNITISSIKRKNILWWKNLYWLIAWSATSVILLKSSSSSDETLMIVGHSSFINECKHSSILMKSFNSSSIINLTSLSLSSLSSNSNSSSLSLWTVILEV